MKRTEANSWLITLLAKYFTIRDLEAIITWARREVSIPPEISPVAPGPYSPDVAPLTTLLFDWFLDPAWREFICVKSSQCGMSQAAQILCCYIIDHQLGDIAWILESATKAKQLNRERIKPMITLSCKALADKIFADEDKLQNTTLFLKGLKVHMLGARTAGQLASRTIPFIFGDEVDEWPVELGGNESNAVALLRERAKLIENAKLAFFSKPRNALSPEVAQDSKLRGRKKQEDGIIWQEYLTGTRHKCYVPCPRCDHFQELLWDQARFGHCRSRDGHAWDFSRMLDETFYECCNCKQPISEEEKVAAVLKDRVWRPTNHGEDVDLPVPGKMSCQISDLYANTERFPTLRLGQLAVEYTSARTTSDRRAFRRGHLALPVEQKAIAKLRIGTILALQGNYEKGTCPVKPDVAFLTVDVQDHGKLIKWQKTGFTFDDTAYVLDYGQTEIDEEIIAIMAARLPILGTEETARCEIGWIDEGDGNTTHRVLDLCTLQPLYRRLSPVKGRGKSQTEFMKDRVVLQKNRTHKGKPIDRYLVDSDYFLDELYEERIGKHKEIVDAAQRGQPLPAARIWLPNKVDSDFAQEFCTEKKDWHLRGGKLVFGWLEKPEGGSNDYSDTTTYALGLWYHVKPMLLRIKARKAAEAERAKAYESSAPGDPR